MSSMMKSVIFCGAFLCFFMLKTTHAQITAWTEPVIMAKDGSATATQTVAEDGTGTFPTIAATATGTLSYTIISQTPAGVFDITPASGLLALAAGQTLDYETLQEHVLVVQAVDAGDATATGTGTATVTITIDDANDAPVFQPARITQCVADGTAASTTVLTLTGTDEDALAANNVLAYTATIGGNTDTDFAVDATSGVLTTANALDKTRTLGYLLEVEVTDSAMPSLSGTATIVIYLKDSCSGAVMLVASFGVTLLFGLVTSLV